MADSTATTKTAKPADPSALLEVWRSLQLVWYLIWDPRVSPIYKLIVPAVILYILSPIDLIPDALVFLLGPLVALDDLALLFFGTKLFIQLAPPDVVVEYRRRMGGGREFTSDDTDTVEGTYRVVEEK